MKKAALWLKNEVVLVAAWILAAASMVLVHPDAEYLEYIDFRTLGLLFCLMTVMAGARSLGIFRQLGMSLLHIVKNSRQLAAALILLCFFSSMVITNDVALITFVPFALEVLVMAQEEKLVLPVVVLQTIAANLGSMATPIGNPQNLYLYGISGVSVPLFLQLMLPYTGIALVLLLICLFLMPSRRIELTMDQSESPRGIGRKVYYLILFLCCLGAVARWIPVGGLCGVVLLATLLVDRHALKEVDYGLLLTFVGFFVFIGNMGRVPAFEQMLQSSIRDNEVLVSVLASQVISNVPAALLMSGFTDTWEGLIVGTNLGGLGTLIASMASLISYKFIVQAYPEKKGRYLGIFTVANLAFLAVLLGLWLMMR